MTNHIKIISVVMANNIIPPDHHIVFNMYIIYTEYLLCMPWLCWSLYNLLIINLLCVWYDVLKRLGTCSFLLYTYSNIFVIYICDVTIPAGHFFRFFFFVHNLFVVNLKERKGHWIMCYICTFCNDCV